VLISILKPCRDCDLQECGGTVVRSVRRNHRGDQLPRRLRLMAPSAWILGSDPQQCTGWAFGHPPPLFPVL
ncbi:MAG: hypothetical protein ACLQVF_44250, partial [Isosphaeraceae bacterium]